MGKDHFTKFIGQNFRIVREVLGDLAQSHGIGSNLIKVEYLLEHLDQADDVHEGFNSLRLGLPEEINDEIYQRDVELKPGRFNKRGEVKKLLLDLRVNVGLDLRESLVILDGLD